MWSNIKRVGDWAKAAAPVVKEVEPVVVEK